MEGKLTLLLLLAVFCECRPLRRPIRNLLHPYEPIEISTTISQHNLTLFSKTVQLQYRELQSSIHLAVELELELPLTHNLTLTAQLYSLRGLNGRELISTAARNVSRYQKVKKEEQQLGSSYDPMDEVESLSQARNARETESRYDMHIPKDFHIMLVWSEFAFPQGQLQPQHRLQSLNVQGSTYYIPPLDLGQLYIPTTKSTPLAQRNTLNLSIFTISYQKYVFFYSIGHPEQFSKDLGVLAEYLGIKDESMDEMKEFMFDNPPWLIALYFLLSCAEVLLKFATIKSEFRFWKDIDKNKGVSLKTLFFQLGAEIILLLYLYEYDAGKIILVFHVLDILVTLWKISRTYSLALQPGFPFLSLRTSDLYRQREQLDGNAIWYMNYLLVPLMAVYLCYALHKRGWRVLEYYRFGLETAVAFIAIFGFILMTPQLYINYKLKSVEHLNWRGLVYRFVTTVIDDVFAFMVTMPALRRMMYFRDDIIFVIYVYQRYIYKVDYQRKTMFTMDEPEGPTASLPPRNSKTD